MEQPSDGAQFELRLFGGPKLIGSDRSVHLSPTQWAFLTIVYGSGGISRARVARILWTEDDTPRARHRIRQLLSSTRSRVGTRCVETEGDMLRPSPAVSCDALRVQEQLRNGSLLEVASALASELVPDLGGTVGGRYEDWRRGLALRLSQQLRAVAMVTWREAVHESAWARARDAAEALHLLDPRDTQAVAMVIEARAMTGKTGAAEAAYTLYIEALRQGQPPDPAVEEAITRARLVQGTDNDQANRASGPFVGRREALLKARSALDRVASGSFAFALVAGEAGIGKSRLLEEIRREAVMRGFRCLTAKAVELERIIPLNPLLDALEGLDLHPHLEAIGAPWNAVINSALPAGTYNAFVGEVPPIREGGLSRRLLDSLAMLLERLAMEQPTVLFLDDLHWADATTVTALQFFQRRWTQGPFGIIAAVRPEQVNDSSPASKYLRRTDGLEALHIRIDELSSDEALDLIGGIADGRLDDDAMRKVRAFAGPHPLYLTELTRDLLSGDARLPELPEDEVPIPLSLQQLLRSRLSNLTASATRIARVLAVAARPLRLSSIASLAGVTLDECVDCVEELQAKRLTNVERDAVAIAHDLFRAALYKEIPAPRRALLHRTLAEHLLEESVEPSAGELAIHFARAGDRDRASQYAWSAATRAWDSGAMAEAALFYELVTETEADPTRRAEATAGLARALHLNRDIARANPLLEMAASRLRAVGDSRQARRMEIRRVEGLASLAAAPLSELIDRLALVKEESRAARDWEAVALTLDAELRLLNRQGDIPAIRAVFGEMREVAEHGSPAAAVLCYAGLAMQSLFGDPEDALKCARKAVALAQDERDHRLSALMRLLVVLQCRGLLLSEHAHETLSEARALAARCGDLRAKVSIESNVALALLDVGELEQAEVAMNRSTAMLGSAHLDLGRFNQLNNRAELALAREEFDDAARWYRAADAQIAPTTPLYARDLAAAGLGLCALETGNLTEARRREQELSEGPEVWFYDPTTILTFRAKLLERRNARQASIDLLRHEAGELRGRHVLAWLKLSSLLIRLMIKEHQADAADIAAECRSVADQLRLPIRRSEFAQLERKLRCL